MQPLDPEMVEQHRLRPHHIGNGQHRKIHPPGLIGSRIDRRGTRAAETAADHIGADDKMPIGIDRLARPHHPYPPAILACQRVFRGDILIAGQRMTDQDGIAGIRVERAIGFIGIFDWRKCGSAVQWQRPQQTDLSVQSKTLIFAHDDRG